MAIYTPLTAPAHQKIRKKSHSMTRSAIREQRPKTKQVSLRCHTSTPTVAGECSGPTGERVTIKWATGDLPEGCRFLLNTQLMFLKKEKDPTSKQFDDDEWIRSLAEAQEATTDRPRRVASCMISKTLTPTKVRAHPDGRVHCGNASCGDFCALSEGENCSLHDIDAADRSGYPRWRRGTGHLSSAALR